MKQYDPRDKTRKFGGKVYHQYGTTFTKKSNVLLSAKELRSYGFKARVVPFQAPKVYGRKKFYNIYLRGTIKRR
jgi:hypothetical protein